MKQAPSENMLAALQRSIRTIWSQDKKERADLVTLRRFAGHQKFAEQISHLRVAHLTDQHVGRVTPVATQMHAVNLVNNQEPDLVVITGDFVCHGQAYLDQLKEVISAINAPVIGVLGNHDYWSGADDVAHYLEQAGAEVLRNAHTTISLGHERLQIVGLDDAYTGHADQEKATKNLRDDLPTIALSHIAEEAEHLWDKGIPLVLSGHTHAGQITLARIHEFALGKIGGHRFVHGLYGSRSVQDHHLPGAVYVGAGIGASVMPLRIGERAKPEVTVFELGYEPGSVEEHHVEQVPLPGRKPSAKVMARRVARVQRKQRARQRKQRFTQPREDTEKPNES